MAHSKVSSPQVTQAIQKPLIGRTVLISPDDDSQNELKTSLENHGARVISWPPVEIHDLRDFAALDEAIDNLFGYDWLLFRSVHAVERFLKRFHQLGHETSELDSLRILALGTDTSDKLERSQVHVDVVTSDNVYEDILIQLENYLGTSEALTGTNFLNLRAANSCEALSAKLEDRGARVDRAVTHRTAANDSHLVELKTLLAGGGIDCVVIRSAAEWKSLAELFDESDLRALLNGAVVAGTTAQISKEAREFPLTPEIVVPDSTVAALIDAILEHFSGVAAND